MSEFKEGDIIRCVDNKHDLLTKDKLYEVLELTEENRYVKICCDSGGVYKFYLSRFVYDIPANRDKIINQVLE